MTDRQAIHTDDAPAALGPYSQAVRHGDLVFISGQIALHPQTMKMVDGGVQPQIEQVLDNLQAVARAVGRDLNNILKLTIYLTDLGDFAAVNETMKRYFKAPYPARATIEVSALPMGAVVEIEAILGL